MTFILVLNAMMTSAKRVVQLSLREGFEVNVPDVQDDGKPVVAKQGGGIPLHIQQGKSGFPVEVGDNSTVGNHLFDMYTKTTNASGS